MPWKKQKTCQKISMEAICYEFGTTSSYPTMLAAKEKTHD
jgi:hypothetical protein